MDKIEQENKSRVLILGGSNFMGKALTKWFYDFANDY